MDATATQGNFQPDETTRVWEVLTERIEALVSAWESGGEPPRLAEFVPHEALDVRHLALVELIKVDLEYRWQQRRSPKRLEEYAEEFPELAGQGLPPALIYEEYHIRKQAGEDVDADEYLERFPSQAEDVGRLLGLEAPNLTTALFSREPIEQVEVGDRLDEFDLLSQLGKGAFATVYLARQTSMQRLVALKVSGDRGTEAQTMAQLDHPHIVRVYDQRVVPDRRMRLLYMQYVSGGTLQQIVNVIRRIPAGERNGQVFLNTIDSVLDQRGESPPTDSLTRQRLARASWGEVVCWIGARLAAALDYAHRHGVLHRDVKPANVLLAADGTPKLVDFNISCSTKVEGASPAAYFGGSLAYMSPEQLEACNPNHERAPESLDGRADVYSLAVMLWELLAGKRPFSDEKLQSGWSQLLGLMTARRREGVDEETIKQLPAKIPPGMSEVLLRAMAPNVEDRYATAGDFARQLELCLQPHVRRLLRPAPRDWRTLARRHSVPLMALCGIVPNAIVSGLNIFYNRIAVENLGERALQVFFSQQLYIVNTVLYSIGLIVLLSLGWPVLQFVNGSRAVDADQMPWLRRRCLVLGAYVFYVSFVLWIISGIVFPYLLREYVGQEGRMGWSQFLPNFVVSQLLCGLAAGALCFFIVTFFAVRAYFPMLMSETTGEQDVDALARFSRRVFRFFAVSISVPFIAFAALTLLLLFGSPGDEERTQLYVTFGLLSIFGGLSALFNWVLSREIQSDLTVLAAAVSPSSDVLPGTSTTLDSFWSSGRR